MWLPVWIWLTFLFSRLTPPVEWLPNCLLHRTVTWNANKTRRKGNKFRRRAPTTTTTNERPENYDISPFPVNHPYIIPPRVSSSLSPLYTFNYYRARTFTGLTMHRPTTIEMLTIYCEVHHQQQSLFHILFKFRFVQELCSTQLANEQCLLVDWSDSSENPREG